MLKSIEGVYRDGKVELFEPPPTAGESPVIVTFLPKHESIDLRSRGISKEQAADLRWRLGTIAEDWNDPAMDVYDEL
jgi:hypothetical protein